MNKIKILLAAQGTFLLLLSVSCSMFTQYGMLERDARNSYRRGDYDKAVLACAQALKINPEYKKALTLIQDTHKAALSSHDNKISFLKQSDDKFKWDQLVSEYESLNRLREALLYLPVLISPATGNQITLPVSDYTDDLKDAKEKAAEEHYQEGLSLIKLEGIDNGKKAALEFKLAQNFVANYKDSFALYKEARASAVLRLAIIPFENKSGKTEKYESIAETIIDETIERIMRDRDATEFLEIMTRDELDHVLKELKLGTSGLVDQETAVELGNIVGAHKTLTGKITQIIYTPIRTVKKRKTEKAKVVIRKEKYIDKNGEEQTKNIRDTVKAYVNIYTITTKASIRGTYRITDVNTAKLDWSDSFSGTADFTDSWATFTGDKRALKRRQKILVEKGEQLAPVEDEMISKAAQNAVSNLTISLKEYAE